MNCVCNQIVPFKQLLKVTSNGKSNTHIHLKQIPTQDFSEWTQIHFCNDENSRCMQRAFQLGRILSQGSRLGGHERWVHSSCMGSRLGGRARWVHSGCVTEPVMCCAGHRSWMDLLPQPPEVLSACLEISSEQELLYRKPCFFPRSQTQSHSCRAWRAQPLRPMRNIIKGHSCFRAPCVVVWVWCWAFSAI